MQGHETAIVGDLVSVAEKLVNIHKEYAAKVNIYDGYLEEFSSTNQDICLKQYALEAFQVAGKMFEEHIIILENFQKHTQASEIQYVCDTINVLKHHLKNVEDCQRLAEDKLRQQFALAQTIEREMVPLKPDIIHLFNLKEKYQG